MNYNSLGKTGLQVSKLGYGAWGIGKTMWLGADDDESLRSLRRAIDQGVNFIDTALGYGDGHSEKLVGKVVREAGGVVHVSSKVPPKNLEWPAPKGVPAVEAFPADWVVECTERSLANLGLETIDVQQFHVWSDEWVSQGDWMDAIDAPPFAGQDPLFRRLHQRPPARQRLGACQLGRCRQCAGHLQHFRPEPRGRAVPGSRDRRGRCHCQGAL